MLFHVWLLSPPVVCMVNDSASFKTRPQDCLPWWSTAAPALCYLFAIHLLLALHCIIAVYMLCLHDDSKSQYAIFGCVASILHIYELISSSNSMEKLLSSPLYRCDKWDIKRLQKWMGFESSPTDTRGCAYYASWHCKLPKSTEKSWYFNICWF